TLFSIRRFDGFIENFSMNLHHPRTRCTKGSIGGTSHAGNSVAVRSKWRVMFKANESNCHESKKTLKNAVRRERDARARVRRTARCRSGLQFLQPTCARVREIFVTNCALTFAMQRKRQAEDSKRRVERE